MVPQKTSPLDFDVSSSFIRFWHVILCKRMPYHSHHKLLDFLFLYIEMFDPRLCSLESYRLIQLMSQQNKEMSRQELLMFFYPKYTSVSSTQKDALDMRLNKIIQRARHTFHPYYISILYEAKKYRLSIGPTNSRKSPKARSKKRFENTHEQIL